MDITYSDKEVTESIISMHQVKGVCLTGGLQAGQLIASLSFKHFKKCIVELGGQDPFVITENTDVDKAVDTLFEARRANIG